MPHAGLAAMVADLERLWLERMLTRTPAQRLNVADLLVQRGLIELQRARRARVFHVLRECPRCGYGIEAVVEIAEGADGVRVVCGDHEVTMTLAEFLANSVKLEAPEA